MYMYIDSLFRSYSYFIQVSLDGYHWVRVVDRSQYLCRSWQELPFATRVVRYIRVVGVHNTMNKSFHLVSFACLHSSKPFQLSPENLISESLNSVKQAYTFQLFGIRTLYLEIPFVV